MSRSPGTLLLGLFAAAVLCGCGGADLAAVEDPQIVPAPAPPAARPAPAPTKPKSDLSSAPPKVAAAVPPPAASKEPIGWDFFGPPVSAADANVASPVAEHLHLRGFWEVDGRRFAQLWAGQADGTGQLLLLAVGESRGGVTVVELGEDTVTVEHPDRVVLTVAPQWISVAVGPAVDGRAGPSIPPRPSRLVTGTAYSPPPPPPRPSADRLQRGDDD